MKMQHPLEAYLRDMSDTRSSGAAVKETSYYTPLANLLNAIGQSLKPKVRCVIHISGKGAGIPDGGFFSADQIQKGVDAASLLGSVVPSRGVMEVKGLSANVVQTAKSQQVRKYLERYRQVLVTNYRDFLLVGRQTDGTPDLLEGLSLASTEFEFWAAAAAPSHHVTTHGERFVQYLTRVLLHAAPLAEPQDVAFFLASYARDAKARVEQAASPQLVTVRKALGEALGLTFAGAKQERFFQSTLVQTLFYGVFSAWVLWGRTAKPNAQFDWRTTAYSLRVPIIRKLFHEVADPGQLDALGLSEVLDWTGTALNRVDRNAFFSLFEEEHAVQYFYEPFLEQFDPELRKELGVWYTPPEIVKYMVERVDTVLREELSIVDGLADPRVIVLDPCCGTGAFLVETLRLIARRLGDRGEDALVANELRSAAVDRVFGFEILPAPFVVAHLQLGLLLQSVGAPLGTTADERAGVFLTNSLIGWEPPEGPKKRFLFPELEAERDAAEEVKRAKPILVVIGNPPYNAFAGVSTAEEQGLVEIYKKGLTVDWGIKKYNLDDLYVRFLRVAERRIAEMTGEGVVCFISSYSYLSDPSYVVLRQRLLGEFDSLWFDSLNGDSRETGKLTPEGAPDPSVFSTRYNREGIRLGTAVGTMVRRSGNRNKPTVRFRNMWGSRKREELLESLDAPDFNDQYEAVSSAPENRFSFRPSGIVGDYSTWPRVVDLCGEPPISGLQEMRRGALMDYETGALADRMQAYFDRDIGWAEYTSLNVGLATNAASFDAKSAREKLLRSEGFDEARIVPYALYPLDRRVCYYSETRPLWNRARPVLAAQAWKGNRFFITRMVAERPTENVPITCTSALPDYHLLRPNAVAIPMRLRHSNSTASFKQDKLFVDIDIKHETERANLSRPARAYLSLLGIPDPDADAEAAELLWMHALAIGFAPAYLAENDVAVRQDWPRIPLPTSRAALENSAQLGREIAALLDGVPVAGVTTGTLRTELKMLGRPAIVSGEQIDPVAGHLTVTAGWGHPGNDNTITMPGKGRVSVRALSSAELNAINQGAEVRGCEPTQLLERLGNEVVDVFLNDVTYWAGVPATVWDYTIGGYRVLKKWLSYREASQLGRAITVPELREFSHSVRRLAAIVLLGCALDDNYHAIRRDFISWKPVE